MGRAVFFFFLSCQLAANGSNQKSFAPYLHLVTRFIYHERKIVLDNCSVCKTHLLKSHLDDIFSVAWFY